MAAKKEPDKNLDVADILADEDVLKVQLKALDSERLLILVHAAKAESAGR